MTTVGRPQEDGIDIVSMLSEMAIFVTFKHYGNDNSKTIMIMMIMTVMIIIVMISFFYYHYYYCYPLS